MRTLPLIAATLLIVTLPACSNDYDDAWEGRMSDHSYAAQLSNGTCLERPDATGRHQCIDRFAGKFVWADYAAPWCQPCLVQARVIKKLEAELGQHIVFLTVMTSVEPEYQSIPTVETARDWSNRFGLEPSRVVVADNLWGMAIPTHILYSPKGQSLYRSSGYMTGASIREVINERTADWLEYEQTGRRARWMR